MKRRIKLGLCLLALCLQLVLACTLGEIDIKDLEAHYVVDEDGTLSVNVTFSSSVSADNALYLDLVSPSGELTWSSNAEKVFINEEVHYSTGYFVLPYIEEGKWTLKVSRSDKTVTKIFELNAPSPEAMKYPAFLNSVKVGNVSGSVYTIIAPELPKDATLQVSAINSNRGETVAVAPLLNEKEKNVAITFRAAFVVYTYMNEEGVIFRKTEVV